MNNWREKLGIAIIIVICIATMILAEELIRQIGL